MKRPIFRCQTVVLASLILLFTVPLLRAQLSTVVVVNFERAVVESKAGKKSSEKFNATLQAKQTEVEKKQKDLEDQQKKLQNGARTLSDSAKADIQRDIDRRTTDLKRINEDAQKDLQGLRDELIRPIAERATAILEALAAEQHYTLVVDVSNPETDAIWWNPKNDITAELIKRIDAAVPEDAGNPEPAKAGTAAPAAPKSTAPANPRPPSAAAPKPPATAPKQ